MVGEGCDVRSYSQRKTLAEIAAAATITRATIPSGTGSSEDGLTALCTWSRAQRGTVFRGGLDRPIHPGTMRVFCRPAPLPVRYE